MSTPNPALVAASPVLKAAFANLGEALTTILTGPAAELPARVGPALLIMDGKMQLLLPQLGVAEEAVVLQQALATLNGWSAKLP